MTATTEEPKNEGTSPTETPSLFDNKEEMIKIFKELLKEYKEPKEIEPKCFMCSAVENLGVTGTTGPAITKVYEDIEDFEEDDEEEEDEDEDEEEEEEDIIPFNEKKFNNINKYQVTELIAAAQNQLVTVKTFIQKRINDDDFENAISLHKIEWTIHLQLARLYELRDN